MQETLVMISAGEPSGDLHGSNLIKTIFKYRPTAKVYALGGPKMRSAGAILLAETVAHSVIGIKGIIKSFIRLQKIFYKSKDFIRKAKPSSLVLIDFPEFNIRLSQYAHRQGVPTYYFVPPQIWAWRKSRVYKIRKTCKYIFATLPFEEQWYRLRRANTLYVGHPFFEYHEQISNDVNFINKQRRRSNYIISLFPGSRTSEVDANLPLMIEIVKKISDVTNNTLVLIGAYNHDCSRLIEQRITDLCDITVEIYVDKTPELMQLSDICVAASGSISLELLYYCKPSIIVYKMGYLTLFIAKKLIRLKTITLVNMIAKKQVVPEMVTHKEIISENDTFENRLNMLNNKEFIYKLKTRLHQIRNDLVGIKTNEIVVTQITN